VAAGPGAVSFGCQRRVCAYRSRVETGVRS
jgi:hypothetical protein